MAVMTMTLLLPVKQRPHNQMINILPRTNLKKLSNKTRLTETSKVHEQVIVLVCVDKLLCLNASFCCFFILKSSRTYHEFILSCHEFNISCREFNLNYYEFNLN